MQPGEGPSRGLLRDCEIDGSYGALIKVVRTKTPRGGDDGWWEGEAGGGAGLFPSLVVEPVLDTAPAARPDTAQQHKLEIVEMESGAREPGLSKVSSFVYRGHVYIHVHVSASVSHEDISGAPSVPQKFSSAISTCAKKEQQHQVILKEV